MSWIRRRRAVFRQQERQSPREMVTGESHYYLGQRYRINVIEDDGPGRVKFRNRTTMDVFVRPGTDAQQREKVLQRWYRKQLKALIPSLLEKWEPIVGVEVADWGVKRMKTKWGSCNIEARRVWLNLELVKKPAICVEYILVHEMVHFLERHHNDQFREYMDQFMPQWCLYRDALNRSPLANEEWGY